MNTQQKTLSPIKKSTRTEIADERGMTLIEVIAVIILIGLIATVVAKGIFGKSESAKAHLNDAKMEKLQSAIATYRLQYNSYPSKLQELVSGSSDSKGKGKLFTPLADKDDLKDIWNAPYKYKSENGGRSYALTSYGADGAPGGEGADQDLTKRP